MTRRLMILALMPALALAPVACGDDEPLVPTSASTPDTPPEVTEEFRAFNQERDAQKLLGQANGVASRYFEAEGTFAGFDARAARRLEPAITWTASGKPATLQVSINEATDDHVVLVTQAETEAVFCEVGEPDSYVASTGSRNAKKAAACVGGWG